METHTTQIDQQILDLMATNDGMEEGMRLLMDNYQEKLYWHIRGFVKSHQDSGDVLQNTFIKVFRNISKFQGNSKLYTWLYRIATNESLTHLQRAQRKKMDSLDDENQQGIPSVTVTLEGREIQDLLEEALNKLPQKQRMVFQLRYYDELSYEDIKDITGTSIGALKASYHHAVKKLEVHLRNAK